MQAEDFRGGTSRLPRLVARARLMTFAEATSSETLCELLFLERPDEDGYMRRC